MKARSILPLGDTEVLGLPQWSAFSYDVPKEAYTAEAIVEGRLVCLIVEDNAEFLASLIVFVKTFPSIQVWAASNFLAAAAILNATPVDLLLADAHLPGEMTGVDAADLAVVTYPEIAVVLFLDDPATHIEGLCERYSVLQKLFGEDDLKRHIAAAILKKVIAR